MNRKTITNLACLLGIAFILLSCKQPQLAEPKTNPGKELVMKAIDAHGGIHQWKNSGALHFRWKYDMTDKGVVVDSIQTVDLNTFEAIHKIPDSSV
ncbi:MAG: hypothetical protein HC904_06405, partial [Blastochloris sp.]|nr:hypothetical protein [Blastochloris sp.]